MPDQVMVDDQVLELRRVGEQKYFRVYHDANHIGDVYKLREFDGWGYVSILKGWGAEGVDTIELAVRELWRDHEEQIFYHMERFKTSFDILSRFVLKTGQ